MAEGLRELSLGLTRERILPGRNYFQTHAQLGAYLLYFWPISFVQARLMLQELPHPAPRVLEVGSGAGPLSAAAKAQGAISVWLLDRNPKILQLASQLLKPFYPDLRTGLWDALAPHHGLPAGPFDLIAFQHVLNELWAGQPDRIVHRADLIETASKRLSPGGTLLILEPALTPTSRDLLALRDQLVRRGLRVLSPCLRQAGCPALERETDTCHEERTWAPPRGLQQLIRQTEIKRKELKWSYLLLAAAHRPAVAAAPDTFRVVSQPLRSKNSRVRLIVCGPEGRFGIGLKPRDAVPATQVFFRLRRGDLVRIEHAVPGEIGWNLTSDSKITLLRKVPE